jgi:hypothetical protein
MACFMDYIRKSIHLPSTCSIVNACMHACMPGWSVSGRVGLLSLLPTDVFVCAKVCTHLVHSRHTAGSPACPRSRLTLARSSNQIESGDVVALLRDRAIALVPPQMSANYGAAAHRFGGTMEPGMNAEFQQKYEISHLHISEAAHENAKT